MKKILGSADNARMAADALSEALAGARLGDEAAIAQLYRALNPALLRYLRHHAGPVAEDLASEVWLAIAPRLRGFDGGVGDLRAIMFSIAHRRVVDEFRHRARRVRTVELEAALDPAAPEGPEDVVVAKVTAQSAVEALVRRLPADQAEIVLLRVLGDLDVAQVAAVVGKSRAAVRVAQHRALRRLEQDWDFGVVTP